MTDEERQRTMDFILRQQAQFSADMQKAEEWHARFAADMERLKEDDARAHRRIDRLERVLKLAIRAGLRERKEFRERYAALVDAQVRTEEIVRGNGEDIKALTAATERNREDISALTKLLEQIARRRNGDGDDADEANKE